MIRLTDSASVCACATGDGCERSRTRADCRSVGGASSQKFAMTIHHKSKYVAASDVSTP